MSWNTCKFSNLYAIPSRNGVSIPADKHGRGDKIINMGELFAYGRIPDVPMELVELSESIKLTYNVEKDDLLFARRSFVASGAGKCAWVKEISDTTTFESSIIRVRLYKGKAVPLFYYYYFQSSMSPIKSIVQQCAQSGIRASDLAKLSVIFPPLPIQHKIADILSAYDDLIENNLARISLLEKMASELYKEWFIRRKKTDWKTVRLKDFGYVVESGSRPKGGVDKSLKDGIPSLGAESIDSLGQFDYTNVKYVSDEFYSSMRKGHGKNNDILLYKDGAYIGKVTLFRDNFPFKEYAVNEHVFILRCSDSRYQNYLYFTLNLPQYFVLMQNLNRNAAQPGLTQNDLDSIKLTLPDEDTIERFNALISPILTQVFTLAKEIPYLTKQRDLLLPRLMSGKLSVEPLLADTA